MRVIQAYTVDADEFDRLTAIDKKYTELSKLLDVRGPRFVTVTMIADVNGMSRQEVLNRPWMLPNFGHVEKKTNKREKRFWRYDEYLDWVAIPEYERIAIYRMNDEQ